MYRLRLKMKNSFNVEEKHMKRLTVIIVNLSFIFSCFTSYARELVNAGVLPYFFDKSGKAYFLIGQEPNGLWADFGGNFEKTDASSKMTAAREFSEETRYVFGKLAAKVKNLEEKVEGKYYLQKSIDYIMPRMTLELIHPKKYYRMYLAEVDFIPEDTFKNAFKVPHFEKKDYTWVLVDDFLDSMKKTENRMQAYHREKQVRRQIFDILKPYHDVILKTIYPSKYVPKYPRSKVKRRRAF